tara:strand:+ start:1238 stop:2467 length:1230 start_codon:yes stop_codon:yes gene_type:complete
MKISLWILILTFFLPISASKKTISTITAINYADDKPVVIELEKGKISSITDLKKSSVIPSLFVAPGLIDIQINGFVGVDFSGPNLTVKEVKKATKALWKAGVTSYFPTIITSDFSRMKENFSVLAKAMKDPELKNSILGFHLEGPYISPIDGFRGAHLKKYTREPNWQEFLDLQNAANHNIKLITVAPELNGAIEFIEKCTNSGVIVSLGHHNGTVSEIKDAVNAGARMATHLGNGCANMINRHYNPLWPQLSEDLLTPSIIADGFHLTREEVRTFYKTKSADNLILVSDALDLAGLPPGEYIRGERKLLLTPNVVRFPKINALAGAASPISKCLEVVMEFTECNMSEAIKMASTNPAKMFSLNHLGSLTIGKRADLIVFSRVGNKIEIHKTFVNGVEVYSKSEYLGAN